MQPQHATTSLSLGRNLSTTAHHTKSSRPLDVCCNGGVTYTGHDAHEEVTTRLSSTYTAIVSGCRPAPNAVPWPLGPNIIGTVSAEYGMYRSSDAAWYMVVVFRYAVCLCDEAWHSGETQSKLEDHPVGIWW